MTIVSRNAISLFVDQKFLIGWIKEDKIWGVFFNLRKKDLRYSKRYKNIHVKQQTKNIKNL